MKATIVVFVKSRLEPYRFDDVCSWDFVKHQIGYLFVSDAESKYAYIPETDILRICVYEENE